MARSKSKNKGSTSTGFNRTLQLVLHITAVIQFNYGVVYFYNLELPPSIFHPFAGKFKFLTFLCAVSEYAATAALSVIDKIWWSLSHPIRSSILLARSFKV